jgi:hypothetical protein
MILFQSFTTLLSLVAFDREEKLLRPSECLYLALLCLVECFAYRWIIVIARIQGTVDYFRGVRVYEMVPRTRQPS